MAVPLLRSRRIMTTLSFKRQIAIGSVFSFCASTLRDSNIFKQLGLCCVIGLFQEVLSGLPFLSFSPIGLGEHIRTRLL